MLWLGRTRHPAVAPVAAGIGIPEPSHRVDPLLGSGRYISVVLGVIAIGMLFLALLGAPAPDGMGLLGNSSPVARLGRGRMERWVVYPVLLWLMGFGGYLRGTATDETGPAR